MNTISKVLGRRVQLKGLIGKRAVKCPYCDFYFMKNGSDLQRHIWAHEGSNINFKLTLFIFCIPCLCYLNILNNTLKVNDISILFTFV